MRTLTGAITVILWGRMVSRCRLIIRLIIGLPLAFVPTQEAGSGARLRGDFYVIDRSSRLRDRLANHSHHLEVSSQSVLEIPPGVFLGGSNGRASWHVR